MNGTINGYVHTFQEFVLRWRRVIIILVLLLHTALANYFAFVIRFELTVSELYVRQYLTYLPLLLCIRFVFFHAAGLNKGLWRYASISDLIKILNSSTFGSIVFLVAVRMLFGDVTYPRSVFILDWLLFILISGGTRLLIRVFREFISAEPESSEKRILIVGAGNAGEMIVREMKNNPKYSYVPIGFIDEDPQQQGFTIHGVPILGPISSLPEVIREYRPEEVLIAVSRDMQTTIREVYEQCKPFNIPIKKMPGINDLLDGNVLVGTKLGQRLIEANLVSEAQIQEALDLQKREGGRLGSKLIKLGHISEDALVSFLARHYDISHMKPISLEDLLQREQVRTDVSQIHKFIAGKSVLVTGAGGSIGSELCRQIVKYEPSNLLMLDRYENSLFEIDNELRNDNRGLTITTLIGDILDCNFLDHIFSTQKPQIVFHAAAYKHVPLMEYNPIEAVKNNILGTRNLLNITSRHRAENFVMISTDKAVNPTSVMGASKRVAEFLTVNMNSCSQTKCSTVRFGNVLGSNGSVIPIFREQLKKGGPLTVTHPEIKRFFMLIPEAVHLVLIAAAAGEGGDIFVLDMGEPIKIVDLAENFIRLSGFIPHKEIKIVYTGLRPGEKLYEDLFDESEKRVPTFHKKLMIAVPEVPSMLEISRQVADIEQIVERYAVHEVVPRIRKIIPNFRSTTSEMAPRKEFTGIAGR